MGSKANATLKKPSFIHQFLFLPSVLLLTHSITSHVLPPNPEFSFPLNLQKKKKQPLHTVLYTKTNTKQGLASCKACSWAGLILNTWTSASRMQQEHLPKHPALSSHPLALCIREVCIVLSEKWNKKTLQWSWNSPEYLHLENKFMLQIHL